MSKWIARWIDRISLKYRIILLVAIFGIMPMIIFSSISYVLFKNQIMNNAQKDLIQNMRKNNELITTYLERVEESAMFFAVDENLSEIMNTKMSLSKSEILHKNLEIKALMNKYFQGIPKVFSVHLYTENYRMVGNYTISNYTPPMYVPWDVFKQSLLYEKASDAKGKMCWIPTYHFEEMYDVPIYRDIQYDYEYLFSAVKQVNCLQDKGNQCNPVLIISMKPSFFEDILASAEELELPETWSRFIVDENGHVVYSSEQELISKQIDILEKYELNSLEGTKQIKYGEEDYLAAYNTLELLGWKQIILVPEKSYISSLYVIPRTLFLTSIVISAILFIMVSLMVNSMTKAIKMLIDGMNRLGKGEFHLNLPRTHDNEMNLLVDKFNEMDVQISTLIKNNYEMRIREKESQIMALNMQMSPHFLYNTLNTINAMALSSGQMEISKAIVSLSRIMQHTLYIKGECCILQEELNHLKDYLQLMKFRFMDAFEVVIDIEERLMETSVPRFMFQPFIENAIIHGFEEIDSGGVIHISGWYDEEEKRNFSIEDNGRGFDTAVFAEDSNHLGIANVRHKLELIYGQEQEFHIWSNPKKGTVVKLRLP